MTPRCPLDCRYTIARLFTTEDEYKILHLRALLARARVLMRRKGVGVPEWIALCERGGAAREGLLTRAELHAGLRWLGMDVGGELMAELMAWLDRRRPGEAGDGCIEVRHLLRGIPEGGGGGGGAGGEGGGGGGDGEASGEWHEAEVAEMIGRRMQAAARAPAAAAVTEERSARWRAREEGVAEPMEDVEEEEEHPAAWSPDGWSKKREAQAHSPPAAPAGTPAKGERERREREQEGEEALRI